jgi:hypothetical protein
MEGIPPASACTILCRYTYIMCLFDVGVQIFVNILIHCFRNMESYIRYAQSLTSFIHFTDKAYVLTK